MYVCVMLCWAFEMLQQQYNVGHKRRRQGGDVPPHPPPKKNSGKIIFSSNFYVNFGHFSGKNHVK